MAIAGAASFKLGMSGDHTATVFVNITRSDSGVRVSPRSCSSTAETRNTGPPVTVADDENVSSATLTRAFDTNPTRGDVQSVIDLGTVTVGAKAMLSVADGEAEEGDGVVDFVVTLD